MILVLVVAHAPRSPDTVASPRSGAGANRPGRTRLLATGPSGTELCVEDSTGTTTIHLDEMADAGRARAFGRSVRRILWQQIEVVDGRARATVHCVDHRRPRTVRVPGGIAFGLLAEGVPTLTGVRAR